MNLIAKQLRRRRIELELSKSELARKAKVARITIIRMEKGNYDAYTLKMLIVVCKALKLDIDVKLKPSRWFKMTNL